MRETATRIRTATIVYNFLGDAISCSLTRSYPYTDTADGLQHTEGGGSGRKERHFLMLMGYS